MGYLVELQFESFELEDDNVVEKVRSRGWDKDQVALFGRAKEEGSAVGKGERYDSFGRRG